MQNSFIHTHARAQGVGLWNNCPALMMVVILNGGDDDDDQ
jgi:hypothetical protein